ncbi:TPA: RNA-binding protein [candidate division CPR2 bacterium]|uniref:RNA-binding protein KhpA n=1 Tax=candidate division CPR2 bacterium GW2011_GWC1_41_48 TaxID=1618344 RepID=A0A0G0W7S5_UNCC2|nr:MAG: hypothetical protein UT47_C0003G0076 [candidate division CPR2 bacterium GW2011_GWC2_39_35]KKR27068.1 MAG: hypothetical protein UT59_C0072G0002 [candidate division CPR2 bacterium GW2011_GWD1_39_7]KKR29360.1 MAG: hypothetical protein UT60_C0003G0037 [candidate division CPR2 bacterium GW2011_GWD2_39_7]KKS09015.1 MAG: hypothetical protein UU65_C0003G0070 [candidate division CPR2 bacterium GW2011_GWC1_41_48]OGB56657.1 MAG: hypothetical protein A2Y27_02030 [candidate division CPR2 bacterium G
MAEIADKEFVEFVVKSIVDNPEQVEVNRTIDEMGVLLELSVAPEDMGKIIGKDGKTAKSIRTLLRVLGAKHDARLNLKIVEPGKEDGERTPERKEKSAQDEVQELAKDLEL